MKLDQIINKKKCFDLLQTNRLENVWRQVWKIFMCILRLFFTSQDLKKNIIKHRLEQIRILNNYWTRFSKMSLFVSGE